MRIKFKSVYLFLLTVLLSACQLQPKLKSPPQIQLKPSSFSELPGWQTTKRLPSLQAFQASCRCFAKQHPERPVGNPRLQLQAKDWHSVCEAALALHTPSETEAKLFFETWFQPMEFDNGQTMTSLFTGYYLPEIPSSLTQTETYNVPIYDVPNNLIQINLTDFSSDLPNRQLVGRLDNQHLVPFYSREDIDHGAIAQSAPVVAYLRSRIDRLFMEIQGSGIIKLPDGTQVNLGYSGKNGLPYTAIGRVLIERGILQPNTVSQQTIQAYLEAHPDERDEIIYKNRSFVFFSSST